MIANFEISKFQAMRCADDDGSIIRFDIAASHKFLKDGKCDARVWAGKHPCQIGFGTRGGKLVLGRLFNNAVGFFHRCNGFFVADGITDANRVRQSFTSGYRCLFRKTILYDW